jgi:hypothetical protein
MFALLRNNEISYCPLPHYMNKIDYLLLCPKGWTRGQFLGPTAATLNWLRAQIENLSVNFRYPFRKILMGTSCYCLLYHRCATVNHSIHGDHPSRSHGNWTYEKGFHIKFFKQPLGQCLGVTAGSCTPYSLLNSQTNYYVLGNNLILQCISSQFLLNYCKIFFFCICSLSIMHITAVECHWGPVILTSARIGSPGPIRMA